MNFHRHTDIYAYDLGFWSQNDIDTWNNEVLRDCDQSVSPVWPGQETCHPQNQTSNALKRYPLNSEAPEGTTNGTATEPVPLAPPIEESHVVLGRPTSPVTLGRGSEPLTFPSRFSTPTLTDGSTIVGSHFWTSPSIHSNGSIRNPNELLLTDPFHYLSLPTPDTITSEKDRFVCLYPGCEVTCRRICDLQRHFSKHICLVFLCPIPGCGGQTFTRKDKLFAHARLAHRELPLTMFEAACAVSQVRQSVDHNTPEASHAVVRETKKKPLDLISTCSENTKDIRSSTQSRLVVTEPAPVNSAQDPNDIAVKLGGLTQATGHDLLIPADKIESHEQSKSISLSLWPPQYLALLELGGTYLWFTPELSQAMLRMFNSYSEN